MLVVRKKEPNAQWFLSLGNLQRILALLWPMQTIVMLGAERVTPSFKTPDTPGDELDYALEIITDLAKWEAASIQWHPPSTTPNTSAAACFVAGAAIEESLP